LEGRHLFEKKKRITALNGDFGEVAAANGALGGVAAADGDPLEGGGNR